MCFVVMSDISYLAIEETTHPTYKGYDDPNHEQLWEYFKHQRRDNRLHKLFDDYVHEVKIAGISHASPPELKKLYTAALSVRKYLTAQYDEIWIKAEEASLLFNYSRYGGTIPALAKAMEACTECLKDVVLRRKRLQDIYQTCDVGIYHSFYIDEEGEPMHAWKEGDLENRNPQCAYRCGRCESADHFIKKCTK